MVGKSLSHYKIEAELGRGGMGIVYRAKDTKLDRTVAIKVLPSAALASEDDRARFYREAKAAAALTHPHIAVIHGVDEAVPEDGPHGTEPSPFIAMEFIDEGNGIDKETMAHIFEPFFTTKGTGKGVGLGLSVAHGIVDTHDGEIFVESPSGSPIKGTKFTIVFPAVRPDNKA
jgi:signal transduction histidine kinase